MTAPLRGTPRASAVPAAQNTAPVAEFRCLFTHDVRRKQKRWQDGYLKFHTFNNRVMVYDEARNFLGDTYYKESDALHEGDALNLDKGVMVEVAEAIGVTQTDLTPLFEKKTKESPARPQPPSQPRPFQKPSLVAPTNASRPPSQLRHKSLNTLLGTPRGPVGKALPMQSPYESRKEKENEVVPDRSAKRQKVLHNTPLRRASSPVHNDSPAEKKDLPLWARTSDAKKARPRANIPPTAEIIELPSEPDPVPAIMSDVTLPSTPPSFSHARTVSRAALKPMQPAIQHKITVQTPKIPQKKVAASNKKVPKTPKQSAPASSSPVSASNRLTNVDVGVQPLHQARKEASPLLGPPLNPKVKSLRLSTGVKRGTLLCQSLPQPAPKASSEFRATAKQPQSRQTSVLRNNKESSPAVSHHGDSQTGSGTTIASKKSSLSKGKRKGTTVGEDISSKRARTSMSPPKDFLDVDDDPEVMHGIMDQQLLVLSSPPPPQVITSSPPTFEDLRPRSIAATRPAITNQNSSKRTSPEILEPKPTKPKSPRPKSMQRKARPQKSTIGKSQSTQKPSIPPVPVFEPPASPQRDVSPGYTEASAQSRTPSISPTKPALSTGGFRKKPRRALKKLAMTVATPEISVSAPAPRNVTVPLPPHPLRANRNGPLMNTTELAAILQQPKKAKQAVNEVTENEVDSTEKSPNRSFRRVRSENDAPIPSTAEDWERRNLSKPFHNPTESVDEPATTATTTNSLPPKKKATGLSALIKKTDPRRKFQRTQSLIIETNVPCVRRCGCCKSSCRRRRWAMEYRSV